MATTTEKYSYESFVIRFESNNTQSWYCLGNILFEETLLALLGKGNSLPKILGLLHEKKYRKSFAPALAALCKTINATIKEKTIEKITFYGLSVEDKETAKTALLEHKSQFKTDFLTYAFSFIEDTPRIPRMPFDEVRALELITTLAKRCDKAGLTAYANSLRSIATKKAQA